jgi:hypothetical protein
MAKPFLLSWEYTPKWKENRSRSKEEQFTVRLRDFSEQARIEQQEMIYGKAKAIENEEPDAEKDAAKKDYVEKSFVIRKVDLERCKELVREKLVSVTGLTIEDGDKQIPITDYVLMDKYCPDLVVEIAKRLLNGADPEELKN